MGSASDPYGGVDFSGTPGFGGNYPTNDNPLSSEIPGLEAWGLPPEVASKVKAMLTQGYSIDEILAFIRGTPWYAQTYPGIQQGIALGIISNEADYRAYLNQANQLFRRYYGRDITSAEMSSFLMSGVGLSAINEQLQTGAAYTTMFGQPLDPGSLATILGSGISPAAYLQVEASYRQLFGRDASPDEISLFLRSGASQSDLQSYNEIFRQYTGQGVDAQTLAGLLASGTSPQALAQHFQVSGDVTRLYQQYGQNAPGSAVADILAGRTDLNTIQQKLQGAAYIGAYAPDIQQAEAGYGSGKLSKGELRVLGEQKAGYTTPMGFKLQRALDQAMQRMQGVFKGSLATPAGIGIGRLGLSAPPNTGPPDVGL